MRDICILGAGSWGTALTILLSKNGHQVTVWSIDPEEVLMLRDYREQRDKLPGVIVPSTVDFTTDLEGALKDKEIVVCAVPSPFVRSTMKNASLYIADGTIIVDVAKGIEEHTYKTMTTIIKEECPNARVGILSGPSHAEEVGRGIPTTIVSGSDSKEVAEIIQDTFMNDFFRVYTSPDVIGIELGGSVKNVIALAAGVIDGLGYGDNTKAALMTRGVAELGRLVIAMGGHLETVAGLSGIGDLIVTCTSKHSRNRAQINPAFRINAVHKCIHRRNQYIARRGCNAIDSACGIFQNIFQLSELRAACCVKYGQPDHVLKKHMVFFKKETLPRRIEHLAAQKRRLLRRRNLAKLQKHDFAVRLERAEHVSVRAVWVRIDLAHIFQRLDAVAPRLKLAGAVHAVRTDDSADFKKFLLHFYR